MISSRQRVIVVLCADDDFKKYSLQRRGQQQNMSCQSINFLKSLNTQSLMIK